MPPDLDVRGRRFWRRVLAEYDLTAPEVELLTEICRLLDRCEALNQLVKDSGMTVVGSTGQVRLHPAVAELRASRSLLGRLVAQLELPDPEGTPMKSAAERRAQRAAQTRWKRAREQREARGARYGPAEAG